MILRYPVTEESYQKFKSIFMPMYEKLCELQGTVETLNTNIANETDPKCRNELIREKSNVLDEAERIIKKMRVELQHAFMFTEQEIAEAFDRLNAPVQVRESFVTYELMCIIVYRANLSTSSLLDTIYRSLRNQSYLNEFVDANINVSALDAHISEAIKQYEEEMERLREEVRQKRRQKVLWDIRSENVSFDDSYIIDKRCETVLDLVREYKEAKRRNALYRKIIRSYRDVSSIGIKHPNFIIKALTLKNTEVDKLGVPLTFDDASYEAAVEAIDKAKNAQHLYDNIFHAIFNDQDATFNKESVKKINQLLNRTGSYRVKKLYKKLIKQPKGMMYSKKNILHDYETWMKDINYVDGFIDDYCDRKSDVVFASHSKNSILPGIYNYRTIHGMASKFESVYSHLHTSTVHIIMLLAYIDDADLAVAKELLGAIINRTYIMARILDELRDHARKDKGTETKVQRIIDERNKRIKSMAAQNKVKLKAESQSIYGQRLNYDPNDDSWTKIHHNHEAVHCATLSDIKESAEGKKMEKVFNNEPKIMTFNEAANSTAICVYNPETGEYHKL